MLKSQWEWQPSLPHSCPSENCHFKSKNEIFYTFLHTTVLVSFSLGSKEGINILQNKLFSCILHKSSMSLEVHSSLRILQCQYQTTPTIFLHLKPLLSSDFHPLIPLLLLNVHKDTFYPDLVRWQIIICTNEKITKGK